MQRLVGEIIRTTNSCNLSCKQSCVVRCSLIARILLHMCNLPRNFYCKLEQNVAKGRSNFINFLQDLSATSNIEICCVSGSFGGSNICNFMLHLAT